MVLWLIHGFYMAFKMFNVNLLTKNVIIPTNIMN